MTVATSATVRNFISASEGSRWAGSCGSPAIGHRLPARIAPPASPPVDTHARAACTLALLVGLKRWLLLLLVHSISSPTRRKMKYHSPFTAITARHRYQSCA